MSEDVVTTTCNIVKTLDKWLKRDVRLFPFLIAYMYIMNIDPIVNIALAKFRDTVKDIVEFKQDLSNVRKIVYASAVQDYESPVIKDIMLIDEVKSRVCKELSDMYCSEYKKYIRELFTHSDDVDKVKLGIVLRVLDKQRVLRGQITRVNVRFDILQGWVRGIAHALQDLGYNIDVERLVRETRSIDLFTLVNMKLPVGYASADSILYPACMEEVVQEVIATYGNVKRIVEVFKLRT